MKSLFFAFFVFAGLSLAAVVSPDVRFYGGSGGGSCLAVALYNEPCYQGGSGGGSSFAECLEFAPFRSRIGIVIFIR